MMSKLRVIFGLLFAAMLALTSVTAAVARTNAQMGTSMVICSAAATTTILVDAQGNQIKPAHLCPKCAAGMTAAFGPDDRFVAVCSVAAKIVRHWVDRPDAGGLLPPVPVARGPPTLV